MDKDINKLLKEHNKESKRLLKIQKEKEKEQKIYNELVEKAKKVGGPKPLF